jgi:hypothetical protein
VTTYTPHQTYRHGVGSDRDAVARAYLATYGRPMPTGWADRVPAPSVPVVTR